MFIKEYMKKFISSFLIVGLLGFMLLVLLPAELLYANVSELPFTYAEYGLYLSRMAVLITLTAAIVLSFLSHGILRWLLAGVFAVDLGAYIQYMFLNKGLDMLGENPDGYVAAKGEIAANLIIWLVVIGICMTVEAVSRKKPVLTYLAGFLLMIQIAGLVSVFIEADEQFYEYPDTEYHLSGYEQYTVSSSGNIILFVVDCFSDRDLSNALAVKPDAIDMLHDFVFYSNADACFFGTFPSLNNMLTNDPYDFDISVNDWTKRAWTCDKCEYFYSNMKALGYECNIYTPELSIMCGSNPAEELLDGKWDNLTNAPLTREVDNEAIRRLMVKMSAYRLVPKFMKNNYYASMSEYTDTVKVVDDPIMHENYDFYGKLCEKGLSVKESPKMFIVQHIMGTHVFENDENGNYREDAGYEETALGCLNILRCYLDELKRLGVYDCSDIIITADHGWEYGQQPVFFIKEEYRESDEMEETDAPISHKELLPTLASLAGMDSSVIGETIYDYKPGQKRTRTLYFRDYSEDYPDVPYYDGSKNGTSNVYMGYTYTGDEEDLLNYLFDKPSEIVPIVDSYH